jgi:hypothetical protein
MLTDVMYCGFTIHGGIFKELDSCRQQVFDVPNIVERNKYSFVDSIVRVHLICCVLRQLWNENVVPFLSYNRGI